MRSETVRLLRYAGFLTWGLAGLPLLVLLWQRPTLCLDVHYVLWLVCFLIFGLAFALTGWRATEAGHRGRQVMSLVLQTVAALTMIRLVCSGQEGALLVIVAAQLGWILPLRTALIWLATQAFVMCLILALSKSGRVTLTIMATYLGFQVLALFSCFLTAREAAARAAVAEANRELQGTRELLANASRLAERERISRDLHDTLGHHLTALSLNLEAASQMADHNTLTQLERAQAVTKLLLSDVRGAVTALRAEDEIGLKETLKTLVDTVPTPRVHLRVPNDLAIRDPVCAQTILRCVQEIVTNAIRHAHAANLWIELTRSNGQLELAAKDDGQGVNEIRLGHGLTGMRERLELVGGRLEFRSAVAQGFHVNATIPLRGGPA
jgi:signal transduction histidine kinase